MSAMNQNIIEVWGDWEILKGPRLVGELIASVSRDKEILSFEYEKNWIKETHSFQIDPALKLYSGKQFVFDDKTNFGAFLDSSPERWGRTLIARREAMLARTEKRPIKKLLESDFLLGVFDEHRMGGLRFKNTGGPFLDDSKDFATPPWSSIRKLEAISLKLEEDNVEYNPKYSQWLQMLYAPGSSLGGARPKATVCDQKGNLWIAKFPSLNDEHNVGAWEYVVNRIASQCGLNVPEAKIMNVGSKHHTFLSKRFDRTLSNKRVHFSSAMTLLERKDGESSSNGVSYFELVNLLIESGAKTKEDLEELWMRIVFSICISNTDDHLRNHGFLLTKEGWRLSPAYDLNPNQYGNGLNLNISETSNEQSLELALEVSEVFRIELKRASKIISKIKSEVSKWPQIAKQLKIPKSEQDQLAEAFRIVE